MNPHDRDDTHEDLPPVPKLRGLAMQRVPQRDLWPGIEARLAPRRRQGWRYAALALAACLVLAVSLRLNDPAPRTATPTSALTVARAPAAAPLGDDSRALVKAHLKMVDDAERSLRAALTVSPQSESLQRLLASAQRQRRELRALLSA